jgi:hypothetical protein
VTKDADTQPSQTARPRRPRRHRALRILALLILVPALLTGLAGIGALWYARGQDFAAPAWLKEQIETRLAFAMPDLGLRFADLTLTVSKDWQPSLHLTEVSLTPLGSGDPVTLSDVTGSFDRQAMLNGQLRPRAITIAGASIHLNRAADGTFGVALGEAAERTETGGTAPEIGQNLTSLSALLDTASFSALRQIEGTGLTMRYEDHRSGRAWTVDGGHLVLSRDGDQLGLRGDFSLLGGHAYATTVEIGLEGAMYSRAVALSLKVEDAPARDIATQSAGLAWLGVLDAPISGAIRVATGEDGTIGPLNGTLQIGAGALAPDETGDPVPFQSARSYFQYDPATLSLRFDELSVKSAWVEATADGRIVLDRIEGGIPGAMTGQLRLSELVANPAGIYPNPLFLAGAETEMRVELNPFRLEVGRLDIRDRDETLSLAGRIAAQPKGWDVSMTARVPEITADALLELWPPAALEKTRDWVAKNVLDGVLQNVQFGLRSEPDSRPDVLLSFDFEDLITTYMKTLPPLEAASGHAELRGNRFVVTADSGRVYVPGGEGLDIAGTSFIYPDTTQKGGPAEVRLHAKGALGDVLRLIDEEPLNLLGKAGRTPDMASGRADVTATLNFDLKKNLPPEEIGVAYSARLTDVRSDTIVPNQTFTAAALDVTGTSGDIAIVGDAQLGGLDIGGTWSAALGPNSGGRSRVEGWLGFSEAAAKQLNLGLPPGSIGGSTRAQIRLDIARDRAPEFRLTSDLRGLSVRLDSLAWSLGRDQSGTLEITGALGAPPRIDRLVLDAPGLAATGTVSLRAGGGLDTARFDRVRIGSWLDAPVVLSGRGKGAAPKVVVSGGSVDLRSLNLGKGGGEGGPLTLTLDRLQVSDSIAIRGMRGEFTTRGGLSGKFAGSVNGRAPVAGTVVPRGGRSAVRITSEQAGAVLSAAGLMKQGREGALDLTLNPVGTAGSYDGLLKVSGLWIQDAPAMASLLSALSIVGLLEQMSGGGILFNNVEADFRLTPSQVILRSSSAVGASMGVSMDGYYDVKREQMDMQGVISPLYALNGIGQIFSRKGEGLVGFNYRLTGPAKQPKVQVNPLSLFTPGMFRDIFRRPAPTTN